MRKQTSWQVRERVIAPVEPEPLSPVHLSRRAVLLADERPLPRRTQWASPADRIQRGRSETYPRRPSGVIGGVTSACSRLWFSSLRASHTNTDRAKKRTGNSIGIAPQETGPECVAKAAECPHHPYGWRWDDEQGWRPTSAETQAVFDADDEDRAFAAEQGHTEPCPICRVNRDEGTGMPDFDCPNSWLDVPEGQEPPPGMCIDGYVRPAA